MYEVLPKKFIDKSISLKEQFGVGDLAWKYEDVIEVITFLKNNNIFIFGGDVLTNDEVIEYTYDNWSCDDSKLSVKESADNSIKYIQSYPQYYKYIYVIVI